MKSDPKECLYCQNNETLHNLMIAENYSFSRMSISISDNFGRVLDSLHLLCFYISDRLFQLLVRTKLYRF